MIEWNKTRLYNELPEIEKNPFTSEILNGIKEIYDKLYEITDSAIDLDADIFENYKFLPKYGYKCKLFKGKYTKKVKQFTKIANKLDKILDELDKFSNLKGE